MPASTSAHFHITPSYRRGANHFGVVERFLLHYLSAIMPAICIKNQGVQKFLELVEDIEDWSVSGSATAILNVTKNWWDSLEAKAIAESKTAWQTLKKDVHWVEDKITAKVPKLQPVVDSMVNSLKATFSKSAVADQTGSLQHSTQNFDATRMQYACNKHAIVM